MKRYNLSQIMKDAHRFYNSRSRMGRTFGECLKLAWRWAKDAIKFAEEREAKIKAIIAHQKPQGVIVKIIVKFQGFVEERGKHPVDLYGNMLYYYLSFMY